MTRDPLKEMFDAEPVAAPARDLSFVLDVMTRVEQRRLYQGLARILGGGILASVLLYLIAPYLTPALLALSGPTFTALVAVSVVGLGLVGLDQARRVIRFQF